MDEKYGEDELTFFLYCLRVLDAEAWRPGNGGIDWGENYWMNPSASLIKDAPMENNGDGEMDGGDGKYANQKQMEKHCSFQFQFLFLRPIKLVFIANCHVPPLHLKTPKQVIFLT